MPDIEKDLEALEKTKVDTEKALTELNAIEQKTKEQEEKRDALVKEQDRILNKITQLREDARKQDKSFVEKFRTENYEKARTKAMERFGYKDNPDALKSLEEEFKKMDSQAVSEDKIFNDFVKAHLVLNPEKYLAYEEQLNEQKKRGEELKAELSGSANLGAGGLPNVNEVQLTEDEIAAARWAKVPIDKYKELKAKGKV